MLPSSVRLSISSRSKSAAPSKDRVRSVLAGDHREEGHLDAVDRPAPISARFIDRLPCERSGTSDSCLSRATTSTALPFATVPSTQSRGACSVVDTIGRRQAHHPGDPRVPHLGLIGARGQHLCEQPVGLGAEDHPLRLAVQGEAVVEQLGALLPRWAPVAAAGGAEAVEAGKDVEGVGSAHAALLELR